jgi:hypothetical protein
MLILNIKHLELTDPKIFAFKENLGPWNAFKRNCVKSHKILTTETYMLS